MPRVQFLATSSHFVDHLRPVYDALPEETRGAFARHPKDLAPDTLTVASSWGDYRDAQRAHLNRAVFFEHGAGFTYNVNHPSYAGGPGRDRVILFANANDNVAELNRAAYPDARHVTVGVPKLDKLLTIPEPTGRTQVAFSWHWDCRVVPETRTAFPHYRGQLRTIARRGAGDWAPLGHSHPRAWGTTRPFYKRHSWEIAETFEEVVAGGSVYVCDTSSTIYEFAALGRPVVVLNAPWYRRDVEHGLRFWRDIPGIQVDHPDDLNAAILEALNHDTWAATRREITGRVYPHLGQAAQTAAAAILDVL
jgi:hypothetical protein